MIYSGGNNKKHYRFLRGTALAAAAVLLSLTLAGCGSSGADSTSGIAAQTSAVAAAQDSTGSVTSAGAQATVTVSSQPAASTTVNAVTTSPAAEEPIQTTAQTVQEAPDADDSADIALFMSGVYYMEGSMTDSDGNVSPIRMAITDGALFMATTMSGKEIDILSKGSDLYCMVPANAVYCPLSASLLKLVGVDLSSIQNIEDSAGSVNVEAPSSVRTDTLNGDTVTVKTYVESSSTTDCYIRDGKLIRAVSYDSSGAATRTLDITTLTADIPADVLEIPSAYSRVSITSLISAMAS